jgi:hypothetical protein
LKRSNDDLSVRDERGAARLERTETEETMMMPFDEKEQERIAFLYELYKRSAGDARQGVPYEGLIAALRCGEAVTKRIQRDLQLEGLVELTTVPPMTHMSRTVMDHAHRQSRHQTIGMTLQGVRLMEDLLATLNPALPQSSASPDHITTV